jgi:hypothetical protein
MHAPTPDELAAIVAAYRQRFDVPEATPPQPSRWLAAAREPEIPPLRERWIDASRRP